MDYANFSYWELLVLIPIPLFICSVIYEWKYAEEYDRGASLLTSVPFLIFGIIGLFSLGLCMPNADDDARCEQFLKNCDHSLVEMNEFGYPHITVIYNGEELFPCAIRRSSSVYWNNRERIEKSKKIAQANKKKEQIINNIIKKGLE